MAAAARLADSRRVCDHASLLYVFLLSLRWRAQSHYCAWSSKINTIRFCNTSKEIRPVLRSSCSIRVCNYCSSKRRSSAGGVVNAQSYVPTLRGARNFICFPPCVALAVLRLSTPLRRRRHKFHFSENFQMIHSIPKIRDEK